MGQEIGMHSERKQTKMMMTTIKKPYKVKKGCHTDQTEGEIGGVAPRWTRPMADDEKVNITR